jgi:hypothetical protein
MSIGPAAVRVFWGLLVKDAAWAAQAVARLLPQPPAPANNCGRRHIGGAWCADELGPDAIPVVGPEVPPGHKPARCALNGRAIRRARDATRVSVLPLPDLRVTLGAYLVPKLGHTQCARACEVVS